MPFFKMSIPILLYRTSNNRQMHKPALLHSSAGEHPAQQQQQHQQVQENPAQQQQSEQQQQDLAPASGQVEEKQEREQEEAFGKERRRQQQEQQVEKNEAKCTIYSYLPRLCEGGLRQIGPPVRGQGGKGARGIWRRRRRRWGGGRETTRTTGIPRRRRRLRPALLLLPSVLLLLRLPHPGGVQDGGLCSLFRPARRKGAEGLLIHSDGEDIFDPSL